MPTDIAIKVTNLTKIFKIYYTPGDFLKELLTRKPHHKEVKVLDDISFEVKKGEVVGFMGRNGAGKSTLLKILTGTLDSTAGTVEMNGRISSILELGTGFHPEYTGRENIFMGGLCLGMSRDEIRAKEQSIIDFSEIGEYIDQPFRTYSSGMKARLTFATAIAVDPEILIVDEALAVGDARFSRKCYDKITQLRTSGKTILMVSHDQNAITTFCDKAVFLEKGKIVASGSPSTVTKMYFDVLFGKTAGADLANCALPFSREEALKIARNKLQIKTTSMENSAIGYNCGDKGAAEILEFGIIDGNGHKQTVLSPHSECTIYAKAIFYEHVERPNFGFIIRNVKGIDIFGVCLNAQQLKIEHCNPGDLVEVKFDVKIHLVNGEFFLGAGVSEGERVFDFRYDGIVFTMLRNSMLLDSSIVDFEHRCNFAVLGNINDN